MTRPRTIVISLALFVGVLIDGYVCMLLDADLMMSNARNVEACHELNITLKERQVREWEHSRKRL